MNLIDLAEAAYPHHAGYKENTTSREAAEAMGGRASYLQRKVIKALAIEPMTSDEVASCLNENILSIRPRLSELVALNRIVDSGIRRVNSTSGKRAKVYRLV